MRRLRSRLVLIALALAAGSASSVESDPLPVPAGAKKADAVRLYNEGVTQLLARRLPQAQALFEAALAANEGLAQAHNNLAYALRMQGRHNFAQSLAHYNRAIELDPGLAQAYMYRGALFVQQGQPERARQDLGTLRRLSPQLAADLERILAGAPETDGRAGVASQFDY